MKQILKRFGYKRALRLLEEDKQWAAKTIQRSVLEALSPCG